MKIANRYSCPGPAALALPVRMGLLALLVLGSAACDGQQAAEDFAASASLPPAGFTRTDSQGGIESDDTDDWRTSPLYVGKVRADPAYPNPTPGSLVTIPVAVLEFDAVRGGLVLRARDNAGRLSIIDEILDADSPGAYVFQFTPALIGRTGLVRVFVLDRFGELISYGDVMIE